MQWKTERQGYRASSIVAMVDATDRRLTGVVGSYAKSMNAPTARTTTEKGEEDADSCSCGHADTVQCLARKTGSSLDGETVECIADIIRGGR